MNALYADSNDGFAMVSEMLAEVKEILVIRPEMSEVRWRRIFLRSVFVLLEAIISKFKGRAFEAKRHSKVQFPEKLLRILEEGRIAVRDGTVWWEEMHPGIRENLTTAVKAYANVLNAGTPMGDKLALPDEFNIALIARNRVTHPKMPSDLSISDVEIAACKEIFEWIMASAKWSNDVEQKSIAQIKAECNASADTQMEFLRSLGKPEEGK